MAHVALSEPMSDAAAFATERRRRAYTHTQRQRYSGLPDPDPGSMPHPPAPAAADTDEQQQQPQCRICLDGPDPDLGRLIRPCLCSGTVSVGQAFPPLLLAPANRFASISLKTSSNSTCTSPVSSVGGIPLPMPRPFSFVRSAIISTALLVQR